MATLADAGTGGHSPRSAGRSGPVFTMFRRAKLMLGAIDPDVVGAAARSGDLLARVRLTDPKGGPLCARVRPPYVEWSAGQTR